MSKTQMIYGRHPIIDAIHSGTSIDKIFLQERTRGDFEKEIRQLAKKHNIPIRVLPKERMKRITGKNHQGVIAYLALIPYYQIEDVVPTLFEKPKPPLLLLLDGVTDVRNFGAIARSAECTGVDAIIIPQKGTAQINADALKTAAGALTKIPICRQKSLVNTVEYLKMSGIQVLASALQASSPIQELDFTLPTTIILGSEDKGVHPSILKLSDQKFLIPQMGTGNSFNVSVAAGITLYETMRQRLKV